MDRIMELEDIKGKINDFRAELISLIDNRLDEILASTVITKNGPNGCRSTAAVPASSLIRRRVVEDIGSVVLNGSTVPDIGDQPLTEEKPSRGNLQEKQFVIRDSPLTELFESCHIRTIYHIFIAILVIMIISSMMHDLIDTGTLNLKFEIIRWCFGGLPTAITMWLLMFSSTIMLLFPVYQHWACLPGPVGWKDCIYFVAYAVYIGAMIILPIKYIVAYDLPLATTIIVACEQVRLIMKVHAFVRENAAYALIYKSGERQSKKENDATDTDSSANSQGNEALCPDFGKFLYFLFAPTLIYRNSYPRTAKVDWGYVVTNFAQVLGCLFYVYYVFSHFCIPIFQNFNRDHITIRTLTLAVFSSVLPGSLCLFLGFFAVLHSWLNAFAEMLRFGDRMFYRDWWNATNLAGYYRTWNVVVHDWLYTYVYRDAWILFGRKGRTGAIVCVFFISALVHEYIITIAFRFFYPVLFIEFFFIGVWLMLVTGTKRQTRTWNVLLWVSLFLGTGLLMCLYSMEWYARINCPKAHDNFLYYLTPHSWICQATSGDLANAKAVFGGK